MVVALPDPPAAPELGVVGATVDPLEHVRLFDVPFVVVDVETTGGAPGLGALTEIAAVRYCHGEEVASVATLVDPGVPIPPFISWLTGITDDMVWGGPAPADVLPDVVALAEGAAVVGHNVAFDLSFLNAELTASGQPELARPVVCTLRLARRLVRDDVPNCRLATLARELRLEHRPRHRALDDVLATADLLHRLIEAATGFGVWTLGDLLALAGKDDQRNQPAPDPEAPGPATTISLLSSGTPTASMNNDGRPAATPIAPL